MRILRLILSYFNNKVSNDRFRNVFPLPENNWGEGTDLWFCHDDGDNIKVKQNFKIKD